MLLIVKLHKMMRNFILVCTFTELLDFFSLQCKHALTLGQWDLAGACGIRDTNDVLN